MFDTQTTLTHNDLNITQDKLPERLRNFVDPYCPKYVLNGLDVFGLMSQIGRTM